MTDIDIAALDEAAQRLGDEPILMVNLLRYRTRADYAAGSERAPCSGREAYFNRYVPAFTEAAKGFDVAATWLGTVTAQFVAPGSEAWDDVAIVRYPGIAAFRSIVNSDAYRDNAGPHRKAALADWRLLVTTPVPLPPR